MDRHRKKSLLKSFEHRFISGSISLALLSSCVSGGKTETETESSESFHADNDIAMTVMSLVDAMRVGEAIDSTDYDFRGVLTDGQGAPLYTDLSGNPGEWVVDVLAEGDVSIKNLNIGDLLPGDLESYLISCLRLGPQHKVYLTTEDALSSDDTDIVIYDFEGGYIRFENRFVTAPNGLEGSLFTIILSTYLPRGVEKQTAV